MRPFGRWCVILTLALLACGRSVSTDPAPSPWNDWIRLDMQASSALPLTGTVSLSRERSGERLVFETELRASLFGVPLARTVTRTELDAATGRPFELVSHSDDRGRRFRFGATGYDVLNLRPGEDEDAPVDSWNVTAQRSYEYPPDNELPLWDYYGMIPNLARLPLGHRGDRAELLLATSRGPRRYTIEVADERDLARSVTDLAGGPDRALSGRELRLLIVPTEPLEGERGFLGMEGETEIWVEADSKSLTSIQGQLPSVGRVTIELSAMQWPAAPPVKTGSR